jgi:hypothetical protein
MKKTGLLLTVTLLLAGASSFQQASAQYKTTDDQEKEQKIQQAIDQQKKAMVEKQAQEDIIVNLKKSQDELDRTLNDINIEYEINTPDSGDTRSTGRNIRRTFHFDEPYMISRGVRIPDGNFYGDNESSTWEFSRSVKDKTFSNDYTFDVEKSTTSVVMSVMGDCKAGDIKIRIVMPGGKTYSDIVLDASGNLNWRKSFTISDSENQDKTGQWKFLITSSKATGFFKISLQTY